MLTNSILSKNHFIFFILAVLCFLAYGSTLFNGFFLDDYSMLIDDAKMHDLKNLPYNLLHSRTGVEEIKHFRPVSIIFRMLLYRFFSDNAFYYHLVNILLFTLSCFLFFKFSELLTKDRHVAFLSSLLFCLHPLNHIAVNFVTGHEILLFGIFAFLSVIKFLQFLEGDKQRALYLSVLFYFLAILTQEINFFIIPVIFLIAFFVKKKRLADSLRLCLPYFLVGILYLVFKIFVSFQAIEVFKGNIPAGFGFADYFFSLLELYGWYLTKFFHPADIVFIWNTYGHQENRFLMVAAAALFFIFCFLFLNWYKRDLKSFLLLWFLSGFLPVTFLCFVYYSAMGPVIEPHWFFFTSGGVFLFLALYLEVLRKKIPRLLWLSLCAMIFISWAAWISVYNSVWKTARSYSFYWLKIAPHNPYALLSIAQSYEREDDPRQAVFYYQKVLSSFGSHFSIYSGMALAFEKMGEWEQSKAALQKALEINPRFSELHDRLGVLLFEEGDLVPARQEFQKADDLDKNNCNALRNLADTQILLNETRDASMSLQRYLVGCSEIEPEAALAKLIVCYYQMEQKKEFKEAFDRYVREYSSQSDLTNLAQLAVQMKAFHLADIISERLQHPSKNPNQP